MKIGMMWLFRQKAPPKKQEDHTMGGVFGQWKISVF